MAKIHNAEELHLHAKAHQMQAFKSLGTFSVPSIVIAGLIPADIAWDRSVAIIGSQTGKIISLAIDDPENPHLQAIRELLLGQGYGATFYLTTADVLEDLLEIVHPDEQVEVPR